MGKAVVLYQSKYGTTEQYARWVAQQLNADVGEVAKTTVEQLAPYSIVILGGAVHASRIAGLSFLRKHYAQLKGKNLAVFAVGASPLAPLTIAELRKENFSDVLSEVPSFYARGALNTTAMKWADRMLLGTMQKALRKKPPQELTVVEQALAQAADDPVDWSDMELLRPLVTHIQQQEA